ncbi:MAG: transposase [Candidatus Latescibacterota bacterium]
MRKAWMAAGELLEKLAALVPPPRLNLVRYHGVLAPAAADRAQIVPGPSPLTQPEGCEHDDAAGAAGRHVQRICWAKLLARVFQYDVTVCPRCSGHMTVIAALTESAAIQAFLTAVGLPPRAPPIAPPRLDRQLEFDEAA